MPYTVHIKRSAEKEMDGLPESVFTRVADAILRLEEEPRCVGAKKLRGSDDYRVRVGAYRVLYSIDDEQQVVEILAVGHRREAYRGR